MSDYLTISNSNEFIRIPAEDLVYIASEGNYSDIYNCQGDCRTVTLQLGILEEMIHQKIQNNEVFARIGKSLIVNLNFIYYINPTKKTAHPVGLPHLQIQFGSVQGGFEKAEGLLRK